MSDQEILNEVNDFVGRKSELLKLESSVQNIDVQPKLLFISGDGGVGKTFIIRKFYESLIEFKGFAPFLYDFDDNSFHSPENLRLGIAHKWGGGVSNKSFEIYLNKYKNIIQAKMSGTRSESEHMKGLHGAATEEWLKTIGESGQKCLFCFDTLDALSLVQINRIGKYFFSCPPDHSLIIIAGRPDEVNYVKEVVAQVNPELFSKSDSIDLKPLDDVEFNEFIEEKLKKFKYSRISDLPVKNPEEYIKFIKQASNGLPILLELSLDQVLSPDAKRLKKYSKDINSLKSIASGLPAGELLASFKKLLIHHFLQNHSNHLQTLVLVLAHAWPMGKQAIKEILGLNDKDTEILIEEARKATYIKTVPNNLNNTAMDIAKSPDFLRLHDVMREMINEYSWDEKDSDKTLRLDVSKEFLSRIHNTSQKGDEKVANAEKLNEFSADLYSLILLLQRLKIQTVRHTTCLDINKGLSLYVSILKGDINEKGSATESQYIDELSHQIEQILVTFHRTNTYKLLFEKKYQSNVVDYFIYKLRFLASRKRFDEATEIEEGIESHGINLPLKVKIKLFEELASKKLKEGKLNEGFSQLENLQKQCIKEKEHALLFHVLISMGWAYRLLGDIESSDDSYGDAEELLIEEDLTPGEEVPMLEVATLYQTWAYVKALLNDFRTAKKFIDIARSKYKEEKLSIGEGYIESVLGKIQIEFDEYDEAIKHFELAKGIIPEDNYEWQSKVLLGMSHARILRCEAHKHARTADERSHDLKVSSEYMKYVEKWDLPADRPETLYVMGNLLLLKKEVKQAEQFYNQSIVASKDQGALYFLYRSNIGLIRVAISKCLSGSKFTSSKEFERNHKALVNGKSDINDKLVEAIFWRTLGDLKFLEGKVEEALTCYKGNLPIIAENGRFYAISLKGQLDRMEDMFVSFTTKESGETDEAKLDIVHKLAQDLWQFWKENKHNKKYREANPVIRSWISGPLDEWTHSGTNNEDKQENSDEK